MARNFDGVDDLINFGSDASIDGFTSYSVCAWINGTSGGGIDTIACKTVVNDYFTTWSLNHDAGASTLRSTHDFATTDGDWSSDANLGSNVIKHVGFTYDRSSDANDPVMYIDGVSQGITENTAPVGTSTSDAANDFKVGSLDGGGFFTGPIGFVIFHNAILTAADVNRHRWWGCAPGGPSTVKVWQPMWTDGLVNRGTATATGTATGTTMDNASIPRVERCWAATMGIGR